MLNNKNEFLDINEDTEKCETKNKIDKVFIGFLYLFKSPISIIREKFFKNQSFYKKFLFNSKHKRMTKFVKSNEFPTGYRLF